MDITPLIVTAASTLTGVLITAFASLMAAYISKKSDERKHMQSLIVQTALAGWQETAKYATRITPVTHYVIHTAMLARLLNEKNLTPELVRACADEASQVLAALEENAIAASKRPIHE